MASRHRRRCRNSSKISFESFIVKILEQRLLRGPNIYTRKTCLLSVLDLQDLARVSSAGLPGFTDALLALVPSLQRHRCSLGRQGGFVQRLHDGTYMGHIIEHVALELQCMAGAPAGFGRTRHMRGSPGVYRVVCAYQLEQLAVPAFRLATELVGAVAGPTRGAGFALETGLAALRAIVAAHAIGPSTGAILDAAKRRGMPFFRITQEGNMFQLGWGSRQKRLQATITGDTGHIGVGIASNKQLTKALLKEAGVPVPEGGIATSVEQAQRIRRNLKGAVAIKPFDGNHGKGVTALCTTPEEVAQAFERASARSRRVIVERHVAGQDYRILVAGREVVAAALRRPPAVIGNGHGTIRELVTEENSHPSRGKGHGNILTRIALDEVAASEVRKQGYAGLDSVPAPGVRVVLRSTANLSAGGTAEDVTDLLPQETRDICVRAVRKVGLDVGGIDLVCEDIARPLREQGAAIIEVNAAPGIRMHQHPSAGTPRDAGGAILASLHGSSDGRIPLIAVTGTNGKTTTTLMLEHCLRMTGVHTGCTTTEGVYLDGKRIISGDCSGYWSARTVLAAPEVDFAVLETARGGILKRGLAFDHCDVAVVLNITADHLGLDGIDTVAQLARVKSVIAQVATKAVVLNAEDTWCARIPRMLRNRPEIIYFSMHADHPVVAAHLAKGGRAAFLQDGQLMLTHDGVTEPLLAADRIPATLNGRAHYNIANSLAAAAALMASSVAPADIAAGLASFASDVAGNPLRTNLLDLNGISVVVDYAHNPAAYRAAAETARSLSAGHTVAVVTAPGDRRDTDLQAIGEACAMFDEVIIYEEENRGRDSGATAALIESGVRHTGTGAAVKVEVSGKQAFKLGLERCRPGDVLLFACGNSALLQEALAA
jgi:cyanophycin synthetase